MIHEGQAIHPMETLIAIYWDTGLRAERRRDKFVGMTMADLHHRRELHATYNPVLGKKVEDPVHQAWAERNMKRPEVLKWMNHYLATENRHEIDYEKFDMSLDSYGDKNAEIVVDDKTDHAAAVRRQAESMRGAEPEPHWQDKAEEANDDEEVPF